MVGWRTSSIRRQHELPKVCISVIVSHAVLIMLVTFYSFIISSSFFLLQYHLLVTDEKYPHIVSVDNGNKDDTHKEASTDVEIIKYDLEGLLLSHMNLKSLSFVQKIY